MAAVLDNLKRAVQFIIDFFNYILSFLTGGNNKPEGDDEAEATTQNA